MGFGKVFEVICDGVIVADAETQRIVLWNSAATSILGYSSSEALSGMRVEDLVPECFKAQHRAGMARYHDTGRGRCIDSSKLLDVPAVAKSGKKIWVELSLSSIGSAETSGAERRCVLALVRDVSERKWAEEEIRRLNEDLRRSIAERTSRLDAAFAELKNNEQTLRESEELYRLLVESAEDYAIFAMDIEGRITNWNPGAERIFGYREEEIAGKHGSLLFTSEDRRWGAAEEELRRAHNEGRAQDGRWHVRKDGTRFWASS